MTLTFTYIVRMRLLINIHFALFGGLVQFLRYLTKKVYLMKRNFLTPIHLLHIHLIERTLSRFIYLNVANDMRGQGPPPALPPRKILI